MFVLTLVLNPFEGVSHFGERAGISPFMLNTVFLAISFNCDEVIILFMISTTRHTNVFILDH